MSDRERSLGAGMWRRFAAAGAIIVLLTAAAVATAALLEVDQVRQDLAPESPGQVINGAPVAQYHGGPETFLILGSDTRAGDHVKYGNSDTMLLLRMDPDKGETTMLSIPRDLQVSIPGYCGPCKINAAYPDGGPQLALRTVQGVLGPGVLINHIVNTSFHGFREAVDALGGVYVDVDRRYFNDHGGPGGYSVINIQPGYQRLNGSDALSFVRFRHLDTDLVRNARQQDFIRQLRDQIDAAQLFNDKDRLLRIFARATQSDILGRSNSFYANLLLLAAGSLGKPIRQVPFQATLGASYVTATPEQTAATVHEFLYGRSKALQSPGPGPSPASPRALPSRRGAGLQADAGSMRQEAQTAARGAFPVYAPRLVTADSTVQSQTRDYTLADLEGRPHRAYRIVVQVGPSGDGQYWGVEGTTWKDPPIVDGPHDTEQASGRTYEIFYDGRRIRTVALLAPGGVYWVSNSLTRTLTNRQILGIATSLARVG